MSYADIPGFMASEYEDFYRVVAQRLDSNARIVEVGCAYGRSLAFLVESFLALGKKPPTIYAVDAWKEFMGCEREDWIGERARSMRDIFFNPLDACLALLKRHSPQAFAAITPIQQPSLNAADYLRERGPFDLVFIDANHTFEAVGDDIIAWSPNVKVGGLLAGDDYDDREFPGVVRAVDMMVKPRAVGTFVTRGRIWIHEVK